MRQSVDTEWKRDVARKASPTKMSMRDERSGERWWEGGVKGTNN